MKEIDLLIESQSDFLAFLKSKFSVFHNSNLFFRDLHYGVISYFEQRRQRVAYPDAEQIARAVAVVFEKSGVLKKIDHQTWSVNYPEFALPRVEKKATA